MIKETLLNWTAFEAAINPLTDQPEPTTPERDLLEFYHQVRINVGVTVGTIEFEGNPAVYVSLEELNEDIGIKGSGITHSESVHQQLKKRGLLESKKVNDDDWIQPSREPVFNFGKLERTITDQRLGEEHPFTTFYNGLVIAIKRESIPVHQTDFNGYSAIVRLNDLYNTGIKIPLALFVGYTDTCEIALREETSEGKMAALEECVADLTTKVNLLQKHMVLSAKQPQEEVICVYQRINARCYAAGILEMSKRRSYTPTDEYPNPRCTESYRYFPTKTKQQRIRAQNVEIKKIKKASDQRSTFEKMLEELAGPEIPF